VTTGLICVNVPLDNHIFNPNKWIGLKYKDLKESYKIFGV